MNSKEQILAVLDGAVPERCIFAPNIWQWFEYQKIQNLLPDELKDCRTQLDVLKVLGVDVFSRNLLTEIRKDWIGGHSIVTYEGIGFEEKYEGNKKVQTFETGAVTLKAVYAFDEVGATLHLEKPLITDFDNEYAAWREMLMAKRIAFDERSFVELSEDVGDTGIVLAGEVFSPLKMLHFDARADNAIYLLFDHEDKLRELMDIHSSLMLGHVRAMAAKGVKVIMSMDNLDSMFYPPDYFDKYCKEFYSEASRICHEHGAKFFVHACGRQKDIMSNVVDAGIDGLEGIAFPPLGDIELWEARRAGPKFIVNGGLSAIQLEGDVTTDQANSYVKDIFDRMRPFDRFIFSMSCNTSILTKWDTLKRYRDAWLKYGVN